MVEGERGRRLLARPRRGRAGSSRDAPAVGHVPVLAQQPDRHGRRPRPRCGPCSTSSPPSTACSSSTRPTASSPRGRRSSWSTTTRPLVVTRTFSKTWSMAAARLGYLDRPGVGRRRAREGRAAVPPRRVQADRRHARPRLRRRDERAGRDARRGAGPRRRPRSPSCPSTCGRRAPTSSCSGPTGVDGAAVWQELVDRSVLVRNCSSWPRLDGCLRVTIGTPDEDDSLPRRPDGDPHVTTHHAAVPRSRRTTKETDIAIALDLDGTGRGRRSRPGIPFFDHMLGQLGRHGGFDLAITATGDLEIDAHHTVEDVGILLGEVFREALGDKAGVRRFASSRRAARRGAHRGRPRPVGPPVPALRGRRSPARRSSATRRSTRSWCEEFWRAFATSSAMHAARHRACGARTPTTSSRRRSRASPARSATRCGSRARGVPSTKGTCDRSTALGDRAPSGRRVDA